jgi:hypothetical protein
MASLAKSECSLACEPPAEHALNIQCGLGPLLNPHCRREVTTWENNFVVAGVYENAWLFHLAALLPHHVRGLCLLLVGLHLALVLVRMVVCDLVCLREGVVVGNS